MFQVSARFGVYKADMFLHGLLLLFMSSRRRDNLQLKIFGIALSTQRISLCPLFSEERIEGKASERYFLVE